MTTTTNRILNFSAGPAVLPVPVLEEAQRDLVALPGVGMSVLEISHRSKTFEAILAKTEQDLRARGLQSLPANLLEAIGELEADDVLRTALGRGRDEDYVDYFVRVKRDEWNRYHEQVTPWEIREYLTRF